MGHEDSGMPTPFVSVCPHCQTKLKLKDPALIGRTARCPACQEKFTVAKAGDVTPKAKAPSDPTPPVSRPKTKPTPRPQSKPRPSPSPKPAPDEELDPWMTDDLDDDAGGLPRTGAAPPPVQGVRKKKPSPMTAKKSTKKRKAKSKASAPASWVGWLVGGSVAGLIGAAVWGAVAAFTWHEAGIIAWGIGGFVGFGVRIAARDEDVGVGPGLTALGIAVASVILGKFLAVHFLLASIENMVKAAAEQGEQVESTDEETVQWIISDYADSLAEEREEQGQEIPWPDWETLPDDAPVKAGYPADLWAEAEQKWNSKTDQEKAAEMVAYNSRDFDLTGEIEGEMFKASFGLLDLLWFFLAAGTAYKVGSGLEDDD